MDLSDYLPTRAQIGAGFQAVAPAQKAMFDRVAELLASDKLQKTWPARAVQGLIGGVTAPHDAYTGELQMMGPDGHTSPEAIHRAADLGEMVVGGGMPLAPRAAAGETILGMAGSNTKAPVKAYHAAYEPFDAYDFSRLGQTTHPNVSGMSGLEAYSMNLAKLGAWASDKSVAAKMAAPHSLPVELSGKAKSFSSLDQLEAAIRKNGGPDEYRAKLVKDGYGHVKVADEEFGVNSFVGLGPDFFRVVKP